MGRLLLWLLVLGGAWALLDTVGISPLALGGTGTRVDGGLVVREAGDLELRYSRTGPLEETYMLFGGDVMGPGSSFADALVAGLPLGHARLIAASYPDFHLCKSPGAAQAQGLMEELQVVAADRAAERALAAAFDLFESRFRADGERTCIRLRGHSLVLDSAQVPAVGRDLTPELGSDVLHARYVLAEDVALEDCSALLR